MSEKEFDNLDELDDNLDDKLIEDEEMDVIVEEDLDELIDENLDIIDVDSFDENMSDVKDFDTKFKAVHSKNKHRMEGKHSLKRDTIFNGKIDEIPENGMYTTVMDNDYSDSITPEIGSLYEFENHQNEEYLNQKNLERDVFNMLSNHTTIDFKANRRKPNRTDFNKYFKLLLDGLSPKYSKSELFVTLAFYFSDNIFNLFKLLDKKHATSIIIELKNKGHLKDIGNVNFV